MEWKEFLLVKAFAIVLLKCAIMDVFYFESEARSECRGASLKRFTRRFGLTNCSFLLCL